VALWREALLAQAVLLGPTKGDLNHPQLIRFRPQACPATAINSYLWAVSSEAAARGYAFDLAKLAPEQACEQIPSAWASWNLNGAICSLNSPPATPNGMGGTATYTRRKCHPLFRSGPGGVADWERGLHVDPTKLMVPSQRSE
jgi:hypothetical protein